MAEVGISYGARSFQSDFGRMVHHITSCMVYYGAPWCMVHYGALILVYCSDNFLFNFRSEGRRVGGEREVKIEG